MVRRYFRKTSLDLFAVNPENLFQNEYACVSTDDDALQMLQQGWEEITGEVYCTAQGEPE